MKLKWSPVIALLLAIQLPSSFTAAAAGAGLPGMKSYRVYQNDKPLQEFGPRKAVAYASAYCNSHVEKIETREWLWDNLPCYKVYQGGISQSEWEFVSYREALAKASALGTAQIRDLQKPGWVYAVLPRYRLYQGERAVHREHSLARALTYAATLSNSSIRAEDNRILWSNTKKLLALGWNGTSDSFSITSQLAGTQGLDIDSPTWFQLDKADGTLTDNSNDALAAAIKDKGLQLMPLVHNKFDMALTSAFLKDTAAQMKFISSLTSRLSGLKADGANLDFENIRSGPRPVYLIRHFLCRSAALGGNEAVGRSSAGKRALEREHRL
ncbi:hypothetical protein [Paenibacillus beijingensis]|uniref:Uncharacterized protein n=1 Tax=Paenibacillus beijingensis TaxID=1126833 RepID=A0A0D5NPJ6_9BACL|nr:hypothetical protein [Paenibacillus beijingensis]AJY77100.1 hypothetical protein VN24_24305 [Paenibacillus beijingensis]